MPPEGDNQHRHLNFSTWLVEDQQFPRPSLTGRGLTSRTKMADNIQIKCINKTNRTSAHERIQNIGGTNSDATRWKLTLDQAIQGIESGKYRFFVSVNGDSVWVNIATSASGHKYLKTQNDGDQPNNLLSLPECP